MDSDGAGQHQRWGAVAVSLHWLMAALILVTMSLGWIAEDMPRSMAQYRMFGWHKSFGLLVLTFAVLRLGWRLRSGSPGSDVLRPVWERRAASISHVLLYVCMFAMPLTGWLVNSAADVPFRWFWLVPVPAIAGASRELEELAVALHSGFLWTLLTLVAIHSVAALRHHFVLHDGVLWRMLPLRRLRR